LPSLARRLLPVIAFALVLGLVLAGALGHARSRLALPDAHPARSAGSSQWATNGAAAELSATVGAIPGPGGRANGRGQLTAGQMASTSAVAATPLPNSSRSRARKLSGLLQADVLVVARHSLPAALVRKLRRLGGVAAAVPVDAGRVQVNGVFVNVLGVNPATFRPFAARPTARSAALWQNVSAGGMAISYTMGHQDRLTLAKPVQVTGSRTLQLPVAGFGTVGIGGVDAVVSGAVARTLGLPARNAVVISAPKARLDRLMARIKKLAPDGIAVAPLVTQVIMGTETVISGAAGAVGAAASQGPGLTAVQIATFLAAAKSRIGMPYVWGDAGPASFDCSGLVQWSMAQAGVLMPRVAVDQARTGPLLRLSDLRPGDLLFYHTDPTAPNYISHVAIYLGNGQMLQAPQPGLRVEIVAADFGAGFAGAVRVYPRVAAAVAGNPAG
jgi:cell wall-associated NlpC family hydrolase